MGCCESHNEVLELDIILQQSKMTENENKNIIFEEEFSDISLGSLSDYNDFKCFSSRVKDFQNEQLSTSETPRSKYPSFHRRDYETAFLKSMPSFTRQTDELADSTDFNN